MTKIELTQEQLNNLLAFLNRVDLKGPESPVWTDLVVTFQRAAQAQRIVNAPVKEEKKQGKDK